MATKPEVPESTKILIRAVLLSQIGGVAISAFNRDFKNLVGSFFDYKSMGFMSLLECMRSIPDVVRIEVSQETGKTRFYGVGDKSTYMTPTHIKAQHSSPSDGERKTRRNRDRRQSNIKNFVRVQVGRDRSKTVNLKVAQSTTEKLDESSAISKLVPNLNGLYSVCIHNMDKNRQQRMRHELTGIEEADEVSVYSRLTFVRFKDVRKAKNMLLSLNGKVLSNGVKLHVSPAKEKCSSKTNGTGHISYSDTSSVRSKSSSQDGVNLSGIQKGISSKLTNSSGNVNSFNEATSTSNEIFVGHLPPCTKQEDLFDLFKPYGATSVRLKNDPMNEKKWFGFVEMTSKCNMERAILELNKTEFHGCCIYVRQAMTTLRKGKPRENLNFGSSGLPIVNIKSDLVKRTTPKPDGMFERYRKIFRDCCSVCLEDFLMDLPDTFNIIVTEVCDGEYFWGQVLRLDDNSNLIKLQSLMDELQFLNPKSPMRLGQKMYTAMYKGEWCRCWIEQLLPFDTVKIFYVDYGNDDVKVRNEVMLLADAFWDLPPQAVLFKLKGLEETSLIENTVITVKRTRNQKSQVIEVELLDSENSEGLESASVGDSEIGVDNIPELASGLDSAVNGIALSDGLEDEFSDMPPLGGPSSDEDCD